MQPSSMYFVTGGWYLFSARVGDELVEVATIHWFDDALEVEWISTASTPELCATLSALLVRGIEGRYGVGQRPVNVVVWDEGRVVPEKAIEATRGARLLALTEGVEERFDVNVNGSMSRLTGLHWHDELRRFDVCDRAGDERYQPSEAALLGALKASSGDEYRRITGLRPVNCQDAVTVSNLQEAICIKVTNPEAKGVRARYWIADGELELSTERGRLDEQNLVASLKRELGMRVTQVYYGK